MARETAFENSHALELLELGDTDMLLDVGTGHGMTLKQAARSIRSGLIAGIDPSSVMIRLARRRNRCREKRGLVELHQAEASRIPYPDGRFNKLVSVHTIYFWPELKEPFEEIRRVACPGARFVLCFRPAEDPEFAARFPASVYRIRPKEAVLNALEDAGFWLTAIEDEDTERGRLIWAIAEVPEAAAR
jgi:ubiquinone/menaquinone biosynthesis C-methylase UbiE